VVDRILDFPQSLWLAAFVFYAWDCARLIEPGTLLISERRGMKFIPMLKRTPFDFRGRELYVPALLAPWRGVFVTRWAGRASSAVLGLDTVDLVRARLGAARWASTINFGLLFVVAPLLTSTVGLGGAILAVAPVVYAINVAMGLHVTRARALYRIPRKKAPWLLLDAVLCAPYGANWTKRVSRLLPEVGNLAVVWDRLEASARSSVEAAIAGRRAEDAAQIED